MNHRIVRTQSRTYEWLVVFQPTCNSCQDQANCSYRIQVLGLDLLTLQRSNANPYATKQCYDACWQHPDRHPHSELYFDRFQVLGLDLLTLHCSYANECDTNQCN